MLLRDRIFSDPSSFALGCMAWVPLAIWMISLVRWMISGEIDVIYGVIGCSLAVFLGYLAINPPSPAYSVIVFISVGSMVLAFPFVRYSAHRRSLRGIDVQDVERAYAAVRARPDNVAAKFKIARLIYDMGYPGHALRIAENCMAQMPAAFFVEEQRIVMRWRKTPTPRKAFDPLPCIECGHPNPPGNVFCAACGAPFILDRLKGKILPSGMGRKIMAAWIVMVLVMAALPIVGSLNGFLAFFGIMGLLGFAVAVLYFAFRSPEKGATV